MSIVSRDAIAQDGDGKPVYLRDIWPTNRDIAETVAKARRRADVQEALCQRVRGAA